MKTQTGKVTHYNADRGFGFIQPDDGTERVFAHVSQIIGHAELSIGDSVEFGVGLDPQGRTRANNVRVLDDA